ncbi:MAG: VWA domain-containing protein, partial [Clostridiales bacterium]|nr:VWA domain-containing protein [Candidatus Crickella merdequi]
MKNHYKKFFAVIMALCVVAGSSAVSFAATSDRPVATWDRSKSKVATAIDGNFESTVTLSLPAAEENLASDVVFVIDNSSCMNESFSSWVDLIKTLEIAAKENGAKVNVGVVNFKGVAESTGLIALGEEATAEDMVEDVREAAAALDKKASSDSAYKGSNLHAGLVAANKMLSEDTSVEAERKYVVVISDGITYTWDDNGTQVGVPYFVNDGGALNYYYPSNSSYEVFKGSISWTPENNDWGSYFASQKGAVDNTLASKFVQPYTRDKSKYSAFLDKPAAESKPYADTVDIALYKCLEEYNALLDNGYKCYAVYSGTVVQYGKPFMTYLTSISTNPTVDFNVIQNEILYHLGKGSKVTDVIGYGVDSTGAAYDFAFVNDIDRLFIREGQQELDKTQIDDTTYGFGKMDDGSYKYVIHYYANGVDGQSDECYIWDINTGISSFSSTEFEYVVKLTNPQTKPGNYDNLMTNISATLTPVSSNGLVYAAEDFEKPVTFYTVQNQQGGGDKDKDAVDTADHMNVEMYLAVMLIAAMALALT